MPTAVTERQLANWFVRLRIKTDFTLFLPKAIGQVVQWHIARRRKAIEKLPEGWQKRLVQAYEKLKAQVRARVEHPFHVVKNIFKYKKTRYKGLAKNDAQLNTLFALSNL